jgi:hypothetical protein
VRHHFTGPHQTERATWCFPLQRYTLIKDERGAARGEDAGGARDDESALQISDEESAVEAPTGWKVKVLDTNVSAVTSASCIEYRDLDAKSTGLEPSAVPR